MGTVPGYWIVHPAAAHALAWASQMPDAKDGPSAAASRRLWLLSSLFWPFLVRALISYPLRTQASYIGFSGSLACPTIQIAALPHMDSRDGARSPSRPQLQLLL